MIDEPDAQASQERLTHVQIAQDASKPVSHDRLHEQAVAIYDLLETGCMSKLLPFMTCLMIIYFLLSMPKALIISIWRQITGISILMYVMSLLPP